MLLLILLLLLLSTTFFVCILNTEGAPGTRLFGCCARCAKDPNVFRNIGFLFILFAFIFSMLFGIVIFPCWFELFKEIIFFFTGGAPGTRRLGGAPGTRLGTFAML